MQLFLVLLVFVTAVLGVNDRSGNFALAIDSNNSTLNGTFLWACHEGAAIEGLCTSLERQSSTNVSSYAVFYHNTSTSADFFQSGILGYDLVLSGGAVARSQMILQNSPTTNIAVPLFQPGRSKGATLVNFKDECGSMYILNSVDDTVYPRRLRSTKMFNWYVCTAIVGYEYQTLAWLVGDPRFATPQNPTCQKVDVKRVFP
jgi:hypothetical protein